MNSIVFKLIVLIILWSFLEHKFLITTKYTIRSKGLPGQLNHTNFVVLADLHNCTFGKNNERLIRRIHNLNPEFILVAGDMINKKNPSYPSNAYSLLSQLSDKYVIYYAYGNHEQKMERLGKRLKGDVGDENNELYSSWIEFKNRLVRKKIYFLDNESLTIKHKGCNLCITGVSIGHQFFERNKMPTMEPDYIHSLVGKSSESYQILISHNPLYFSSYSEWGADLTISGHLHGGIIRIPGIGGLVSPQVKMFPKYDSGVYQKDDRHLVVSRGLGSHSIMPRLFNIPELIYVKLVSEDCPEGILPEKVRK